MKLASLSSLRLCAALALSLAVAPAVYADGATYVRHNLVSDGYLPADHVDAHLVNAWGIAFNPTGPVWVANNGTGTSTIYDGSGKAVPLVVAIPTPTAASGGNPTGMVYNGSAGFVVSQGTKSGPARFLFATEDGVIAGWSPDVDLTHALAMVRTGGAIYKGLAIGACGQGGRIYATDFYHARVDVFDTQFKHVMLAPDEFVDPTIPHGFAPFGIQNINGDIYVSYAKQDAAREDDVHGAGLGYVNVFTATGHLIGRVASRGALDAPWGMALAPAGFGRAGNTLLIGNFGDGRINAFEPVSHMLLGSLRNASGQPIHIDGLWGLAFGNGYAGQSVDTLYFTSGPGAEAHGLYGRVEVSTGYGN